MSKEKPVQLNIDTTSVAVARRELKEIVRGNPIAEAAVEGFSDWEAIEALERMWAVALTSIPDEVDPQEAPGEAASRDRAG